MKLIEALKQLKYLMKKAEDYRRNASQYSADMEFDQPPFPDMKMKVAEYMQGHSDLIREINHLRYRLQKTNVLTQVTLQLHGKAVTKSIYEWIQRRKELADLELKAWQGLTDKGLTDRLYQQTNGASAPMKMRRYYDPVEKERRVAELKLEPVLIDSALEIANCQYDLVE